MSAETRQPTRSRENTRARLLDAAHEVFGEVGLDAASVEAVCERAGFTRGAFYSNFASKEELFLALVARISTESLDAVAGRVRSLDPQVGADPATLVREVVGASVGSLEPRLASELRTQALRDERIAAAFLDLHEGVVARVREIIAEAGEAFGLSFRMPIDDVARVLLDVADATCELARIEGKSQSGANEALGERLQRVATALVDG